MSEDDHSISRRLTTFGSGEVTVIVVCSCGDKFKGRSDREAESAQFNHMVEKGQAF